MTMQEISNLLFKKAHYRKRMESPITIEVIDANGNEQLFSDIEVESFFVEGHEERNVTVLRVRTQLELR